MLTRLGNRDDARALISSVQLRAHGAGLSLREPPPEPSSCCGRGCAECVWHSYLDAVDYWQQEALLKLGT